MDSSQVINVVIFGLSLRALHQVKNILESITPEDTYLKWSNITDPNLDWLLINEVFLDSPNIQHLINIKPVKVLKLTKLPVGNDQELSSFCYETLDKVHLRRWVMKNIYDKKTLEGAASINYGIDQSEISRKDIDIQSILKQIVKPTNGRIKLFDKTGELAICDLNTQWVWSNSFVKSTDHTLNFTHTRFGDILDCSSQQQHYKFWLWNLIWNSPELCYSVVDHRSLKLKIWPQPTLNDHYSEIIKMSALFAKGATMHQVVTKLDLSLGMVQRFIAASTVVGFMEVNNTTNIAVQDNQLETKELGTGIKRFFSNIRRRLGL